MLRRLFPATFDNIFRGHTLARWLLYPLTFVGLGIGLVSIFRPDSGAQSADGIPLNTFGSAAAQAVIGAVALLGWTKLLINLIVSLVLVRYRSMIPLMYLIIVADYLAHKAIGAVKPIVSADGAPGGYLVPVLILLSIAGLCLSLVGKGYGGIEREPRPA